MTTETILPPNATPLELALEQAMLPGADVRAGIELIRTAKENPPDDWLYWLVWEYGLEELLPYLPDPRVVLVDGLQWQRIRGTPNSIKMALSWIDLTAIVEENEALRRRWYEYSLDPGKLPTRAELENLFGLARLSAPVGTRLARVFHGYDYRRGRWDYSRWSDGSLYSDDSGVYDPRLDADLSFGRVITGFAELGDPGFASLHTRVTASDARYEDRALYCFSEYDDIVLRNERFAATVERFELFAAAGVGRNLRVLDGSWPLDGSVVLDGGNAPEQPQYSAAHETTTTPEPIKGWDDEVWGEVDWYGYGAWVIDPFSPGAGHATQMLSLDAAVQTVALPAGTKQVFIDNRGTNDVLVEFLDAPLDADSFRIAAGFAFVVSAPTADWDGSIRLKRPAGSAAEPVFVSAGTGF